MTKDEVDQTVKEGQMWRCSPCSKLRRQSVRVPTDADKGKATIGQVITLLEEAKQERKRIENETNTSIIEFLTDTVKEHKSTLDEQVKRITEYIETIEELKQHRLVAVL